MISLYEKEEMARDIYIKLVTADHNKDTGSKLGLAGFYNLARLSYEMVSEFYNVTKENREKSY